MKQRAATATERLAQQRPWWEPGTASGYHANNQGHLVGEVIRRITNTTFKQFVADEIAKPLGADFQIGARESDWGRIAELVWHYRDLRLGTVDASVVTAAERLGVREVATLDRRHFGVVRPRHCATFTLLPSA